MGLKGDVHESTTIWSQSPWRVKLWLAFSLFLASGAIASLSDTVFRWKGFISDALAFYRLYISGQLSRLLQAGFAPVPPGLPDFIILSVLLISANLRIAIFALPNSKTQEIARRATSTYIGSASAILIGNHYVGRDLDGGSALGLFIGSALCASISYWRAKGAARILWFISLLGPFLAVGILAACVSGWQRVS